MRAFSLLLLAGCAAPPVLVPSRPAKTEAPPPVAPAKPPELPNGLSIDVNTDPDRENHVFVDLRFDGPLAAGITALPFHPLHDVKLSDLSLRHAGGSLHAHYALTFTPSPDPTAPASEAIELQIAGEDLFALPDLEERLPIRLKLRTGGSVTGGASSFALGTEQRFEARMSELRRAYFLAGDVGNAQFHASDGDDFTAWIGHTAFDPRWVGAEAAATRSAIDTFVGRGHSTSEPPLSFLIVPAKRDDPPVVFAARTRGLFASADRRAVWNAPVRIHVAQALAQRYLGGFLWVGARDPATEAQGWFFSDGFSRTVAREVLFDAGMIDAQDRAKELNELLAVIAFAPDPRRVATANGALLATALDVAARKNKSSLQRFLRERLADAATKKVDTIAVADFVAHAREAAGDAFAEAMSATLARGAEVPLPSDLLGKCWRLERRQLVPFELGFVTTAGAELTVASVKPKSRAEAAGVRVGDVVLNLDYRNGQSGTPVKMTVKRGDKKIPITFAPAGAAKPGRIFDRVAGIRDDQC